MRISRVALLVLIGCTFLSLALLEPQTVSTAVAQSPLGTVAYVRGGTEIRLIDADGSHDRALWATPVGDPRAPFTVSSLDWKPDAAEIAFASDHERLTSLFERDVYALGSNGSGLRKLTNGPVHGALTAYPTGSVTVTVRNDRGGGPYLVYLAGAQAPQTVAGAPGSVHTLTFANVADFGPGHVQGVVGIFGQSRWFNATAVDVQTDRTVHAGTLVIDGQGLRFFGAFLPSWRSDGTNVGFMQGCGAIKQVPANPLPGDVGVIAAQPNVAGVTCSADWAPLPALNNHVLYSDLFLEGHIYRTTTGSTDTGELLVTHRGGDLLVDLQWLPDGSGFVYVLATDFDVAAQTWQTANLYLYRFATKRATPVTAFSNEVVRSATVSPDGQWIVFERAAALTGPSDLWIMQQDGTEMRLFVKNGGHPAWSPRVVPQTVLRRVLVPLVRR